MKKPMSLFDFFRKKTTMPAPTKEKEQAMPEADEKAAGQWHKRKSALMEERLGKAHKRVMHAIPSYAIGGSLDLYYYPNGAGTAIATKELSELPGQGSSNHVFQCYELVMFTRQPLDLDATEDENPAFWEAHAAINAVLNAIARYSAEATLDPTETCQFPADYSPTVGGRCLIFDGYPSYCADERAEFGLLAVIEVFPSEMEYAMEHGGAELLQRLKAKGHYPYSDLDREPVV